MREQWQVLMLHRLLQALAAAALARRFGLRASMGSDFHDPEFRWTEIGRLATFPADLTPVWACLEPTA